MPAFLDPAEAEFWVGAGLLIFLAIAFWFGRGAIFGTLDAKAVKVRADLDEAARLRSQAEALLADIRVQRAEAETQAAAMLTAAKADAERLAAESQAKLEARMAQRERMAEAKIANAEAQAIAEVKATAAELAANAAERVLAVRLARGEPDSLLDRGIAGLAGRFN